MAFPYKWFRFPFASSGNVAAVPDIVQGDGSVSYPEGYGPDYALDPATQPAALNIERTKANQLYNDITAAMQWLQTGVAPAWIDAATNGGASYSYALNAIVNYPVVNGGNGKTYRSLIAANTATPGTDATKWQEQVAASAQRIVLTAPTIFNVTTAGSDSTGDGSVALPWRTIQKAVSTILLNYDLGGFQSQINVGAGTFAGANMYGLAVGQSGLPITINGAGVGTTIINTTMNAGYGAFCLLQNMSIGVASGYAVVASEYGRFTLASIALTGAPGTALVRAQLNAQIQLGGNLTISGGSAFAFDCSGGSSFFSNVITITLTGTPAFSSAFANATMCGTMNLGNLTFVGGTTGPRYLATLNGVINSNGNGANYFPGNSAGSASTGGQYA